MFRSTNILISRFWKRFAQIKTWQKVNSQIPFGGEFSEHLTQRSTGNQMMLQKPFLKRKNEIGTICHLFKSDQMNVNLSFHLKDQYSYECCC